MRILLGLQPLRNSVKQEVLIKLANCSMVRFRFSAVYDVCLITIKNVIYQGEHDEIKHILTFQGSDEVSQIFSAHEKIVLSMKFVVMQDVCRLFPYLLLKK